MTDKMVDEKNNLVRQLHEILLKLGDRKVDRLCDKAIFNAVKQHPAIELKSA